MSQINDVITESLELFNQSIKDEISRKRMDTTGNARNSLMVLVNGYKYASVGIYYLEYLNRGRPPGKFPPMDVIAQWVDLKGLQIDPYVVARSIANEAARIYRNPELGLKLEEKTQVLQDGLNEKLPEFISNMITTELNNAFKAK